MSATGHFVKRLGALRPADSQSEDVLREIPDGAIVRAEITRPSQRSIQHHRLFFALVSIVAEQMDWTREQMLCWAKVAVGHCEAVQDRDGVITQVPKSIAFARMTQSEFTAFFDAAVKAILDRLLPPGTPRADLIEEVEERAALMSRRAA